MFTSAQFRRAGLVRASLIGLVAVVLGGLLTIGVSAPASASVAFTLKLTSKSGSALSGYEVYPVQVEDGNETAFDSPVEAVPISGQPGYYSMSLVSNTTYTLAMYPGGAALNSATLQYLGGTATLNGATTFTTSTTHFLAASIATGGTITGKVTGPTGTALKDAEVDSYIFDGTNWIYQAGTETSSKGTYSFANAVPGSYKFQFYSPTGTYPTIFSGGATSLTGAASSYVAVGASVTVNQKFAVGTGAISGQSFLNGTDGNEYYDNTMYPIAYPVTDLVNGVPLSVDYDKAVDGAKSGSTGKWTVNNLPAGNYVVQQQPQYWGQAVAWVNSEMDDAADLDEATVFTVRAGHTTNAGSSFFGLDFTYDGTAPQISLTTSVSGASVAGVTVSISPVRNSNARFSGTAVGSSQPVTLYDSDGDAITQNGSFGAHDNSLYAGYYTVTVIDPQGNLAPVTEGDVYFGDGNPILNVVLTAAHPPTFSVAPSIANTATNVGTLYTVSATGSNTDQLTYQWLRDGKPIFGATSASYQSAGADFNTQLSVRVGAAAFGYATSYEYASVGGSTPTLETIGDQLASATAPSILPGGTVYAGTTLTANVGTWTIDGTAASGLTYQYIWTTGSGDTANGSTYVVQPGDVGGTPISLQVIATKNGFTPSAAVVASNTITAAIHAAPVATTTPTANKKISKGVTSYSVSSGTWNTPGLTYSYAWTLGSQTYGTSSTLKSTAVGLPTLPAPHPLVVTVTTAKTSYLGGTSGSIDVVKGTDTSGFTQTASPFVQDVTQATTVGASTAVNYGDTLSVTTPGVWTSPIDGPTSGYAYQWYRNGAAIAGATSSSYTVGVADMSSGNTTQLSVGETVVSKFYASPAYQSTLTGLAQSVAFPTSAPVITYSGPVQDGHTVSAVVGAWGGPSVVDTYQWYDCPAGDTLCPEESEFVAIPGATGSSLAVTAAMGYIYVTVTGTAPEFVGTASSSSADAQVDPSTQIELSGSPKVAGTSGGQVHVGVKLSASPATSSVKSVTATYDWYTEDCSTTPCGSAVIVHTGSTYTPTPTDYSTGSSQLYVTETATKAQYGQATSTSMAYAVGLGTIVDSKAPSVTTLSDGYLSVSLNGVYTPSSASPYYSWKVDGSQSNAGAQASTFDPSNYPGAAIWVDITSTAQGYAPLTEEVIARKGSTMTASETITGSQYGATLGLSVAQPFTDAASPDPRVLTYQWYSGTKAIAGQKSATYTPSSSYVGKKISVKVTGPSKYYQSGTVTSNTITLAPGSFGTPANPTISFSGALYPGAQAIAVPDTTDYVRSPSGSAAPAYTYKWQRDVSGTWTTISGATSVDYTPAATDVGLQLRVEVTATKTGYTTLSLYSTGVTVNAPPAIVALTPPSFGASQKVGSPITINPGAWNTPSLTYTYAWYRNSVLIPGVTSSSWTPTGDSAGDEIQAQVTASRSGYSSVTAATQTVAVQLGDAPVYTTAPAIKEVGSSYTVSPGTWTVDGLTYSYQWTVGGDPGLGTGSNSTTYTPASSEVGSGELLAVTITVSRVGYTTPSAVTASWSQML